MTSDVVEQACEYLSINLDAKLTYHTVAHTRDVCTAISVISDNENISKDDKRLLLIAAAYHDSGFTRTYSNHEQAGVTICFEQQPQLTPEEKTIVEGLIMATRITHKPINLLEMIIRDADLDYLGRMDYPEISENLYKELRNFDLIKDRKEWLKTQLNFIKSHTYYTLFSKINREPTKAQNLAQLG